MVSMNFILLECCMNMLTFKYINWNKIIQMSVYIYIYNLQTAKIKVGQYHDL